MARSVIATTGSAGNATNASIFTMPAGYEGFISSLIAHNSTAGSLDLTLTLTRAGIDNVILSPDSITAADTKYYAKGASKPIFPLTMLEGDILKAQGSGAGITVTVSGLRFSNS
jgi:hypothetical protein